MLLSLSLVTDPTERPTTERRRITPMRVLIQQRMLEEEKKRLAALKDAQQSVTNTSTLAKSIEVA